MAKRPKKADDPVGVFDPEVDTFDPEPELDIIGDEVDAIADLREAEQVDDEVAAAAKIATDEAGVPEPITGPRVKIENGSFVSVPESDVRERVLLIDGVRYEHVSDVVDQGETVWVYRAM